MLDATRPAAAKAIPEWLGFPGDLEEEQRRGHQTFLWLAISVRFWFGLLLAPQEQADERRGQCQNRRSGADNADGSGHPGSRGLEVLQFYPHRVAIAFAFLDEAALFFGYLG